jgi:hypothetical protein
VERTDNTACPGVLVPDVIMLLSDGDSLFDDNNGNVPFEGAPTTSDHLAISSTATATGCCEQQTLSCEIREEPAATAMDRCWQHRESTRIQCGLGMEIRQKPRVIGFEVGTTRIDVGQDSPVGLCKWVAGVGVLSVVEHGKCHLC